MRLLLLLVAVAAAAGLYLYLDPESGKQLKDVLPDAAFSPDSVTVYKWRDAHGNWQLTDTPPPAGVEFERTTYHEDQNVLPVPPGIAGK